MKKVILILCGALISTLSFAQYNVGTSTQQKDIWGTGTAQQRSNNANTSIWSW